MSLEKSMNQWAQVSIQAQTRNFRLDSWGLWHQRPRCNGKQKKMVLGLEVITYLNHVRVQRLKHAQLDEQLLP